MEILIVEDELLAVRKLTTLLKAISPNHRIVGVTDGISSTVEWLHTHLSPQLILMDIELSDGQCFDIFTLTEVKCPVIFTSSYDEHAIQSFRLHSLNYLLKPIKKQELEQVLHKFYDSPSAPVTSVEVGYLVADLNKRARPQEYKNQFLAKSGHQLLLLDAADIAYFLAIDGQTFLFGLDKNSYTIDYTLEELAEILEPGTFFRVNSQCIVNAKAIDQTYYVLNGKLKLDLKPRTKQEVFVSPDRQKEFKEWIGQ